MSVVNIQTTAVQCVQLAAETTQNFVLFSVEFSYEFSLFLKRKLKVFIIKFYLLSEYHFEFQQTLCWGKLERGATLIQISAESPDQLSDGGLSK